MLFAGPSLCLLYNDAARPLIGVRHPAALLVPARVGWPDAWNDLGEVLHRVLDDATPAWIDGVAVRVPRADSVVEHELALACTPVLDRDGEALAVLAAVADITDRVVAGRRLRVLAKLRDLAEAAPGDAASGSLAHASLETLLADGHDVAFAAVYLVVDGHVTLAASSTAVADEVTRAVARAGRATRVVELRVATADAREVVIVPFGAPGAAQPEGFLAVGLDRFRPFDDDVRSYLELAAVQVRRALAQRRAHEVRAATGRRAAERAEASRERRLTELGIALDGAGSIHDIVTLIAGAARELLDASVASTRLAAVDRDAATARAEIDALLTSDALWNLAGAGDRAVRMDTVALHEWLARHGLASTLLGDERPCRGWLAAPIPARDGSPIGLLQVADKQHDDFTERDADILVQLAHLTAARVESFEHHQRAEAIAAVLHRDLLSDALPDTEGVDAAAAYTAGSHEAEVGRGWYDIVLLDGGRRLVIAVGDMVGRGIAAAAAMMELRTSLRNLTHDGVAPGVVLGRLNEFVHTVGSGHFATYWYECIDRESMTLTYANASHAAPVVLAPDRAARAVAGAPGAPVGAQRGTVYEERRLHLAPGATVVLATNAFGDASGNMLADGWDRRIEQLVDDAGTGDPTELVHRLTGPRRAAGAHHDDLAVVAIRVEPVPPAFRFTVPIDVTALGGLRRELRRWLMTEAGSTTIVGDMVLAVSEIVTNAIEHAVAPRLPHVEVAGEIADEHVVVTVHDTGHWRARRHQPERGRGIAIARTLVDVDIERAPDGTTVRLTAPLGGAAAVDSSRARRDESVSAS